ncbi:MAG: DUF5060 domain-containing protein [Desulfopila sp.]|jgi:hypothetical protein|nr:DUF5060 domain-containing protein [Desulfopila sp.]
MTEEKCFDVGTGDSRFYMGCLFLLLFIVLTSSNCLAKVFADRSITQYSPVVEWSLVNATYTGNPFDLVAKVTFSHTSSETVHTTEMFYDGGDTWKFRFAGTLTGNWAFFTSSDDGDLHGHSGSITVLENSDSKIRGFIMAHDKDVKKWARQYGPDTRLMPFLPHYVMYDEGADIKTDVFDADIQLFLREHGFSGFHVPVMDPDVWVREGNPNLVYFSQLEELLDKVNRAGYACHLWIWGDESRNQYPLWGINGEVDKRLQRYIAARLGPIPGWSAGYGFDLWEWVNEAQLDEWHDYLKAHLGWPHPLGARADKNQFNQISEKMEFSSYELHKENDPVLWYEQWRRVVRERPDKPAFSEDRFRIRGKYPEKDVTAEETRRGLYYAVLAGGAAGIWGNLKESDGTWKSSGKSFAYTNKDQIKTWSVFWSENGRFLGDMEAVDHLSDGYVLHSASAQSYVAYKEETVTISLILEVSGTVPVVAVDTKAKYSEVSLGEQPSGDHTFLLPYQSDWIIAAGSFVEVPQPKLEISSRAIYYGDVVPGENRDETLRLSNGGSVSLDVYAIAADNPVAPPFSMVKDTCSNQTLHPHESCTLILRYQPVVEGDVSDSFDIPTSASRVADIVYLFSGKGQFPWILLSPIISRQ